MNATHRSPASGYWFRPVSASGFGLMRIGFGLCAFFTMLFQLPNIDRYFGPAGILTREAAPTLLRSAWRFSLLDTTNPATMHVLFGVMLVGFVFVILGLWTRLSLLISLILLYSFHEYGTFTLDGGDTLMRLLGFILVLSPCDRTFTLTNLWKRIHIGRETGADQPATERTMPIWPYRLLLWQVIVMYSASAIEKWSGKTWISGSAVALALHHQHFARLSTWWADQLSILSPTIGYFTLITQSAWVLLLVLPCLVWLKLLPSSAPGSLKRALLLSGVLVHGGILLLMDVGTFSLTVFAAYLGLLLDEDFRAMRATLNYGRTSREIVLFDGRCGFCKGSVITLKSFDWLHRLQFENLHDPKVRETFAPHVGFETLKKSMHVKSSNGRIHKGFRAFRALSWHVPPMWIFVPFLYLPGMTTVGEYVYEWVADHRI